MESSITSCCGGPTGTIGDLQVGDLQGKRDVENLAGGERGGVQVVELLQSVRRRVVPGGDALQSVVLLDDERIMCYLSAVDAVAAAGQRDPEHGAGVDPVGVRHVADESEGPDVDEVGEDGIGDVVEGVPFFDDVKRADPIAVARPLLAPAGDGDSDRPGGRDDEGLGRGPGEGILFEKVGEGSNLKQSDDLLHGGRLPGSVAHQRLTGTVGDAPEPRPLHPDLA